MRIALTSDHHYHSYPQFARRAENGVNSRLADMLVVEDYARQRRVELGTDLHIRAGDLWDKKNIIDAVTFNEVGSRITGCGTWEWILKGNHDLAAGGVRNTLESLSCSSVTIQATPCMQQHADALFGMVPHIEDAEEQRAVIKELSGAAAKSNNCAILCIHGQVAGALSGSEIALPGKLSLEDLCLDAWDYVFLGHVHEPQQLAKNCWYIGSQCQRNFSDDGSVRRMFILDTDTGTLEEEALPGPRFRRARIQSEADWDAFRPDKGAYYRIGIETPSVTADQIRKDLDGKCLGVTFSHGVWTPQLAPRLDTTFLNWEDLFKQYIKETNPPLDHADLLSRALQLRSDANGDI